MNRTVKKMLVAGTSLLMMIGIGAGTSVNAKRHHRIRTHRTYRRSSWHQGTPAAFHQRSYWISNLLKGRSYLRYAFPMSKNKGINLFDFTYKTKRGKGMPGTDTSAFAEDYPYYKALGHGKYLITCGDSGISHRHGHLYYDLGSNVYLVKMHGRNHLALWSYDTSSKRHHKYYRGYYTQYAHNKKRLDKILNAKGLEL